MLWNLKENAFFALNSFSSWDYNFDLKKIDAHETQWELIEIKNRSDYIRELGNNNNNGYNTNSSCTNYPFYIVKSRNTNFSGNNTRCLQFNLKQMTIEKISNHLDMILTNEKIKSEKKALGLIAKSARGSMRDALSLTDQAIAYSGSEISEKYENKNHIIYIIDWLTMRVSVMR